MDNKSPHLDQLRIDRNKPASGSQRGIIVLLLLVLVVLGAGGAGAYYYFQGSASGIPIHAIMAQSDAAGDGGSNPDASGYVVARRQATLSAQIIDKVIYLNAEEGQRVKQGDVIARLDDTNQSAALRQAEAQERQAEAQERQAKAALDDATPIYTRYQRLRDQSAISTDQFENERTAYDAARTALAVADSAVTVAKGVEGVAQSNEGFTTVRAPFDGVVTVKVAQIGDIVSPSTAGGVGTFTGIATVVDMDSLEVDVDVSENYIDRVRPGQKATIVLNAYPDWQIPASVIAIIPTADQSKGTVSVRIAIEAKDPRILPQMGARVSFLEAGTAPRPVGITVPLEAVAVSGASGTVFVVHDDTVEARQVKLGLKTAQSVTVLSGLAAGDRIATGDLAQLHDGAKVKIQE
jgi:RND family efflux transporter MFP subunit